MKQVMSKIETPARMTFFALLANAFLCSCGTQATRGTGGTGGTGHHESPATIQDPTATGGSGREQPSQGSAQSEGVTTPDSTAEKKFTFFYTGVVGPVEAKLVDGWKIELLPYPRKFQFMLEPSGSHSGIQVDANFCSGIDEKLKNFEAASETDRAYTRLEVRNFELNKTFFKMLFLPTADGLFEGKAFQAAMKAFPEASLARFDKSLKFSHARVEIMAAQDALVRKIGNLEELEFRLRPEFFALSYSLGTAYGKIQAYDLLCDIYRNKAQIVYTVQTSEGFEVTSTSQGIE